MVAELHRGAPRIAGLEAVMLVGEFGRVVTVQIRIDLAVEFQIAEIDRHHVGRVGLRRQTSRGRNRRQHAPRRRGCQPFALLVEDVEQ